MNRRYDRYLVKKYPKLFRDRYKSMRETCMCWGFEHGDGWFNIILNLCYNIQSHIDWTRKNRASALRFNRALMRWVEDMDDRGLNHYFSYGGSVNYSMVESSKREPKLRAVVEACPQVVVDQVKEKFGTLRFYYHGGDETVDGMVRMAESMSSVTCEVCGNKGKIQGKGWVSCRCREHKNG